MDKEYIEQVVLATAARSKANKRKVGAVLVHSESGLVLSTGYNYHPHDLPCEDEHGQTVPEVVHAEIACIENTDSTIDFKGTTMYVSHPPCDNCQAAVLANGISAVRVIESFMKFDGDKVRYDLVPPSAVEAIAKVLTYGARKYKPNNWKLVEDPERYIGATLRHFEAYRAGEYIDPETGHPHLAHALTNLAFLLELEYHPRNWIK